MPVQCELWHFSTLHSQVIDGFSFTALKLMLQISSSKKQQTCGLQPGHVCATAANCFLYNRHIAERETSCLYPNSATTRHPGHVSALGLYLKEANMRAASGHCSPHSAIHVAQRVQANPARNTTRRLAVDNEEGF
jgi:hypothetical protein